MINLFNKLFRINYGYLLECLVLNLLWRQKRVIRPSNSGFFSNFNRVMNHLVDCESSRKVKTIEVDWQIPGGRLLPHFSFGRPEDGNIWEHCFEALAFPCQSFLIPVTSRYYTDSSITGLNAYSLYKSGNNWRNVYHSVFEKYIRIKPGIVQKVNDIHSRYMAGKRVVGVHVRYSHGGEEQPPGSMPTVHDFIHTTEDYLKSHGNEPFIFLSTDTQEIVHRFRRRFNEKVLVQPGVYRVSLKEGRELHVDHPEPCLKLGEEVLIDCLLLARCDAFIHITSNIATAVGYINPTVPMVYCMAKPEFRSR